MTSPASMATRARPSAKGFHGIDRGLGKLRGCPAALFPGRAIAGEFLRPGGVGGDGRTANIA